MTWPTFETRSTSNENKEVADEDGFMLIGKAQTDQLLTTNLTNNLNRPIIGIINKSD